MARCRCGTVMFRCKSCTLVGCNNTYCKARMNAAKKEEDGRTTGANQCRRCESSDWEQLK